MGIVGIVPPLLDKAYNYMKIEGQHSRQQQNQECCFGRAQRAAKRLESVEELELFALRRFLLLRLHGIANGKTSGMTRNRIQFHAMYRPYPYDPPPV